MKRPPGTFVLPLRRKGYKGPPPCTCATCCAAMPWRLAFKRVEGGELNRKSHSYFARGPR